jgi:uncharacterized protein (TIGR03437 family)
MHRPDMSKNLTFKGTVVEYNWENPHTHIPLPTSLGGVTVNINGTPAPIYFVSPGQLNVQDSLF